MVTIKSKLATLRKQVITNTCQRQVAVGSRGPLVSFTFDDFPRTALTMGGEILKAYGARGTYYTAMGLMNTVTELGEQFHRDDLDTLLLDKHELASHTYSHVSSRTTPQRKFRDEIRMGQSAIDDLFGNCQRRNFAFPYGDVTLGAKRVVNDNVASARSIWAGINGPMADLNLLRANRLYGDRGSCPAVRRLILDNEMQGGWLIFYTHDVQSAPSQFGCTPELLEFAVSFASRHVNCIGTVSDVVTQLR